MYIPLRHQAGEYARYSPLPSFRRKWMTSSIDTLYGSSLMVATSETPTKEALDLYRLGALITATLSAACALIVVALFLWGVLSYLWIREPLGLLATFSIPGLSVFACVSYVYRRICRNHSTISLSRGAGAGALGSLLSFPVASTLFFFFFNLSEPEPFYGRSLYQYVLGLIQFYAMLVFYPLLIVAPIAIPLSTLCGLAGAAVSRRIYQAKVQPPRT